MDGNKSWQGPIKKAPGSRGDIPPTTTLFLVFAIVAYFMIIWIIDTHPYPDTARIPLSTASTTMPSAVHSTLVAPDEHGKDIRFYFEPNSAGLALNGEQKKANEASLAAIDEMLRINSGSKVLLRGHVDDTDIAERWRLRGDSTVSTMALAAIQLSEARAEEVRDLLVKRHPMERTRIEVQGAGWGEPFSKTDAALNRRVEVHWFTLE